jgi:hypothetical protein
VFINNKTQFEQLELAPEIQYANVATLHVEDLNEDGILDLLLGGNQYNIKPQFGPYDASSGWVLYGKSGSDLFETPKSLRIPGEIRDFETTQLNNTKLLISTINNDSISIKTIQ